MDKKFDVKGMTCAACQAHVQKAVEKLEGVESVNVNLLSNSMDVKFDESKVSKEDIINAVNNGGYTASLKGEKQTVEKEKNHSLRDLIVSFIFMLILMYVAMGHMVGLDLPPFLNGEKNALAFSFTQFLLTIPVIYIYRRYFINGFKRLFKSPNMDSLIAIGSSAALFYGIFSIYMIGYGLGHNNMTIVHSYMHNLYFESAVMILTLVSLGKYLEGLSKKKTTKALEGLMDLAPKEAILKDNDKEIVVSIDSVNKGDIVIVKKGMKIPVDGKIISGSGSVEEANLTGESMPVFKNVSDNVFASTVLTNGYLLVEALKVGKDTSIETIIQLVEEASNSKAPISKLADKISFYFVPTVFLIAITVFLSFLLTGNGIEMAFNFAISTVVISCPCALGLATPVAIMVGTGKGAEAGLLIKNAEILENAHQIKTIVLDKTGTITEGKPCVTDVINLSDNFNLDYIYSLESKSEHPLASAIKAYCIENKAKLYDVTNFDTYDGLGIIGQINDKNIYAGNLKLVEKLGLENNSLKEKLDNLSNEAKTPLIFLSNDEILGIIAVKDKVKENSKEAISILKKEGIRVVMLTGDNNKTAMAIAKELDIKDVYSDVLPKDKMDIVEKLKQETRGLVAMVGDGVNDSLALTKADLGIAIGTGSDIAIDSSDIILLRNDLLDIRNVITLSRRVLNTIKGNLFWAFFYNIIGIVMASGILYPSFNIKLNPMIGSLAMSLSSIFVVLNALTINLFKPKRIINKEIIEYKEKKEEKIMKKEICVEGMMCMHCQKHVKDALEKIEGVSDVNVSLEDKKAYVSVSENVSDETLINAITEAGYKANI